MSIDNYTSGSGTWLPPRPGTLVREGQAPGGGGGGGKSGGSAGGAGGGGEGGYFSKTDILSGSESFAWSVGNPGVHGTVDNDDATDGGDVTIGLCVAHGGMHGGGGEYSAAGGAGGTASGGDTNTTGQSGSNRGTGTPLPTTNGGNGGGANGGVGGASDSTGGNATGSGCGGGGGGKRANGGNGSAGYVRFTFTPSSTPGLMLLRRRRNGA